LASPSSTRSTGTATKPATRSKVATIASVTRSPAGSTTATGTSSRVRLSAKPKKRRSTIGNSSIALPIR
jgi:hypothetical protein